jgi:hypothetical protein
LSEAETLLLIARVLSQSENLRNKILLTSAPASSLASDIVKQDARISFTAALGVVQSYRLRIAEFRQTLNKEMQGLEESSLTIWDHLDEDYGVTE